MKHLRHPLRAIREPFGTAGLVVAMMALIFALAGGAYAASGGLTGKQKKEVEKIAKKYAGKAGKDGAAGPQGPAGAGGSAGAAGSAGPSGATGVTGKAGSTGPTGATGQTGFTETLPSGKSETGTWSLRTDKSTGETKDQAAISFSIPLAKAGANAFYFTRAQVEAGEFGFKAGAACNVEVAEPLCVDTGCRWALNNVEARPESKNLGTLCVFGQESVRLKLSEFSILATIQPAAAGYGPSGAFLELTKETSATEKSGNGYGTWAVTAP